MTANGDYPWQSEREWSLTADWQTYSLLLWLPVASATSLRLTIEQLSDQPILLQTVSFRLLNQPNNQIRNAGFEVSVAEANETSVPGWAPATLWNDRRALGWQRVVTGAQSPSALEIGITDAVDNPYRLGLEQLCGEFRPGATVTLSADLFLPADLDGAYAEVLVYLYQEADLNDLIPLQLLRREATPDWLHLESSAILPMRPYSYQCTAIVNVIAERPLRSAHNIARFDNLLLLEKSGQPAP
jgi:hypothetical protein